MKWNPAWSGPRLGPDWIDYCNEHPVAVMLGLETLKSGEDEILFELASPPAPNPNGAVHGGLLAAALDHALAVTAMLAMPDDALPNTAGMNVQYLLPAMPPLALRARVTRGGRALVFTRAEVYNRDQRLCATADGTFAIVTPDRLEARP
jgi:uncharacterized protein (TIGR00369 family)